MIIQCCLQVILLSSPVSGQPLTASTSPSPEDPFVKELASMLDPLEAARLHNSSRVETFLPYELRAIEHGLATAVRSWELETLGLEKRTVPVVKSLLNKVISLSCSYLSHKILDCSNTSALS